MGFFKEFKEDASQAVKELMPGDDVLDEEETEEDIVVNTLEDELDVESELSKLNGLLEAVTEPKETQNETEESVNNDEEKQDITKEEPSMSMESETPVDMPVDNFEQAMPKEEAAPVISETPFETQKAPAATDEVTVITEGTVLNGNIQANGSIDLRGVVQGDVQCNGKLTVTGTIQGNTSSVEFFADSAKLEGEVTSSGIVKIGLGSVIVGNISATSAVIAGAIKGDIDVQGPVVVDTSAVVMGNIKSRSVQINNGAVIEGFCSQCYADIDVESLFGTK